MKKLQHMKVRAQTIDAQRVFTLLCPQSNQMLLNFVSSKLHNDHSTQQLLMNYFFLGIHLNSFRTHLHFLPSEVPYANEFSIPAWLCEKGCPAVSKL